MGPRRKRMALVLVVLLAGGAGGAALGIPFALADFEIGPTTERVSVSAAGAQADSDSYWPSLTADGRYIAFHSWSSNLVPGDTNGNWDIFVKDRETGSISRANVADGGTQAERDSQNASFAPDGRYVAFDSSAANLVAGDTNEWSDVFLHDLLSGKTIRVSVSSVGAQANGASFEPSVSEGGRFVAFVSGASNLVPGDTNGHHDIFVRNLVALTTERMSVSSAGVQSDGESEEGPAISTDGRYVAFASQGTNLVPGDTNSESDIFVHDRLRGETERVSVSSAGGQGNGSSHDPSLSADGRYVAFVSWATDLVPGDAGGWEDVFVRDRLAGTMHWVSVSTNGTPADDSSHSPVMSDDGRFVAFVSESGSLVPGDSGDFDDVFVRDLRTGRVELVSVRAAGGESDADSGRPVISADGRYVAFDSWATNVVIGDTNGDTDIFVVDRGPQSFPTPFSDIGGSPYRTAIEDLSAAGIVNGYATPSGWEFRPQNPLWRAQFAKMLNGAWGLIVDEYLPAPFSDLGPDVLEDLYPHEHVAVAAQHGITVGITPSTFGPYRNLTRAQLITMVVRGLQKFAPDALRTPTSTGPYVLPATDPTHGLNIRLAEYNGLLDGIELSGWDVWQNARRGETAQVLHNMRGMAE